MAKLISEKPTVIDLFCGAGGLSKGFEMAEFEVLLGVDNNPIFMKTFHKNYPNAALNSDYADVRKITRNKIRQKTGNRAIDVVIGGPPCQGFSMAGLRDPNDPRNSLFKEFVRLVHVLEPKWFVMENVVGLLVSKTGSGEDVDTIIQQEFEKIKYKVKRFTLLAADYGVPQKRKRLFYVGTNTDRNITPPPPTHAEYPQGTLHGPRLERWVPVGRVLLPESEVPENYFHSKRMIEGFRRRKERNTNNGKGFGWQILDMNKPSYTISARYWKDGSDALVRYSDERIRMLTERECARIQSFPDDYEFVGSKRQVYTQIGNAVPPLLAKAIALEIKKKLKYDEDMKNSTSYCNRSLMNLETVVS
jgi:DNA (cytosine-5)-methyltransferase 1